MKTKYVCYYRVSTDKQKDSDLGLKSQRSTVRNFIKKEDGVLLKEFEEVQSASAYKEVVSLDKPISLDSMLRKRPQLIEALRYAKSQNAVLIFKEVSRLTRRKLLGEFLMSSGVRFISADSPNDNSLIISIKIALSEEEAITISKRTKAALAERLKTKGAWSKGSKEYTNGNIASKGRKVYSDMSRKNPNNRTAKAMIDKILDGGKMNLQAAAQYLNDNGFLTSRGKQFHAMQVKRLYERA